MHVQQSTKAVIAGVVAIGTLILLLQLKTITGSHQAHAPPPSPTLQITADAEMEWQIERQKLLADLEKAEQRANLTAIIAALVARDVQREKEKATPIIVPLSPPPVPSPLVTPSTAAPASSSSVTPSVAVPVIDIDPSSCINYRDSDPFDMPLYCQPLHAIVSGYSRNVTHLFDRLKKDGRPYTYYTHGDRLSPDFLAPNEGDEGHPFFRFIVDHYDHLPQSVVLLHDDTPEQAPQVLDHMRCLVTTPALPYTPTISCYPPWQLHDTPRFQELVEIFGARPLPTNHPVMHFHSAAYFAVGRDAIRKVPREAYRKAITFIVKYGRGHTTIGLILEHFWHAIWGAHEGSEWGAIDIENNLHESCLRYQPNCTHIHAHVNYCKKPHRHRVYSHSCGV